MKDKDFLLKLYKLRNKTVDTLLHLEHFHKKMEWEKSNSYAAGKYSAYTTFIEDINNLINEIENKGNQP